MTKKACEGVKVLDFSWAAVGPMSVRYLADHGATAIHVQSWSRPCFLSYQRPKRNDISHPDYGYWAAIYNASKMSITLNLEKQGAQAIARRLITQWQPDILVESFTPGVMKRFGLDYESVGVIFASFSTRPWDPHASKDPLSSFPRRPTR